MKPDLHDYYKSETFYEIVGMPDVLNSGIFDNSEPKTSSRKHFPPNTQPEGVRAAQNQHVGGAEKPDTAEHARIIAEMSSDEEIEELFRDASEGNYCLDSGRNGSKFEYMDEIRGWPLYTLDGNLRRKPLSRTPGAPSRDPLETNISELLAELEAENRANRI